MKYKFQKDLTSDVLFKAYGKDLKEVFENSALAMFSVICDLDKVKAQNKLSIEIESKDEKDLLYNWLQELIAQVDIEGMFFSSFKISEISRTGLKAEIFGEPISKEKGGTVVKAVTNYKFGLKRLKGNYISSISLDI
jgi:SHS2 domain-containing protein